MLNVVFRFLIFFVRFVVKNNITITIKSTKDVKK